MVYEKLQIEGLLLIKPDIYKDTRGYFFEAFRKDKYSEYGISEDFVQDNISKSPKDTIRGLHYQVGKFAQGKLCGVISGKVLDIAVDIRFGSPTFGHHYSVELSDENNYQIWIPPGFAHAFSVLSDDAIFHYKCTAYYSKKDERAIIYNDRNLNIDWKVKQPTVSEKDLAGKNFSEIEIDFKFR